MPQHGHLAGLIGSHTGEATNVAGWFRHLSLLLFPVGVEQ